jgi:acyl-CoA thioester hydrolase
MSWISVESRFFVIVGEGASTFRARFPRQKLYTSRVEQTSFRMTFEVTAADIDPLGHASNISYVRWIQDVAVSHSAHLGLDLAAYGALGGVFVVRRHEVDYLRPALRGNLVEARTWLGSVMAAKCIRHTELWVESECSESATGLAPIPAPSKLVARASTVWGFVDMASGRPTRIPAAVRDAFGAVRSGRA